MKFEVDLSSRFFLEVTCITSTFSPQVFPFNSPASYPECALQNGDVPVVGMTIILDATFFFLTPERNQLEMPASSQIKFLDQHFKMDRVKVSNFAYIIIKN